MNAPLRLVSVVYEAEYAFLDLQARSMDLFVPARLVREIIVIDNSAAGMAAEQRTHLAAAYGRHVSLVRVIRPKDLGAGEGSVGWRSQQALKLAVARLFEDELYVVLDAKNHFVRPVDHEFFHAPDGRARVNTYGYRSHPLRPALEHVLGYLGVDASGFVDRFTATVTPFVLDAAIVRAMMADIEGRSGRPFVDEFLRRDLTEFFLYTGWIVAGGRDIDDVFDVHQRFCPTVWPRSADAAGVAEAIARSEADAAPMFSVHRRALAGLDPDAVRLLATFWARHGLFASVAAAEAYTTDAADKSADAVRAQRRRELPARLRALPRAVGRRVRRAVPG